MFVPVYVRFLGVEAYGVVGAFVAIQALLSLLDLGVGPALTRELAMLDSATDKVPEKRNLLRTLEICTWGMGAAMLLIVAAIAGALTRNWLRPDLLSDAEIHRALVMAGLAFALQWPTTLYSGGLMGLQRHVGLAWIIAGSGTLRALACVAALWLVAPTLESFFVAQSAVNLIQTLCCAWLLWRHVPGDSRPRFELNAVRSIMGFATGMLIISATTVILTQVDKAVLSKTLTLEEFGYYAIAGALASGLYVIIGPVFAAIFPRFSELTAARNWPDLRRTYRTSNQLIAVAVLPITAVMALFAFDILLLWTRDSVIAANANVLLSSLILGNALNGLMNVPYALQLAHGWTRLTTCTNILAIVIFTPITYVLSTKLGALGGALTWILLTFSVIAVATPLIHRRLLRGGTREWLIDIGPPAIVAFTIASAARLVLPSLQPTALSALFLAVVTLLAYAGALLSAPALRSMVRSFLVSSGH
jgi:O-antigen/teichoic acid export membrane protein